MACIDSVLIDKQLMCVCASKLFRTRLFCLLFAEKEPLIALDLDMDIDEDLSVARASVNDTTLATVIEPAGVSLVPGNDDNTLLSIRAAIDQDPPSALSDPACDSRLAVPTPERLVMSQPHDHVKSKGINTISTNHEYNLFH